MGMKNTAYMHWPHPHGQDEYYLHALAPHLMGVTNTAYMHWPHPHSMTNTTYMHWPRPSWA